MTLFEVDRVFWTRQDFCLGEPLGKSRILFLTRSPLHANIATDKTCLQMRGHFQWCCLAVVTAATACINITQ